MAGFHGFPRNLLEFSLFVLLVTISLSKELLGKTHLARFLSAQNVFSFIQIYSAFYSLLQPSTSRFESFMESL